MTEIVDGFEWETDKEKEEMKQKLQELDVGEGALVFERVVANPSEQDSSKLWLKMKFEATLDPRPGVAERVAILVSGQDISDQVST